MLSKIEPTCADEAQYNIAYPVATAIVHGDFGIDKVLPDAFVDSNVLAMMKKLRFEVDKDIDNKFPTHRICRAEIYTKDGSCVISPDCEPREEANEGITNQWLADKFYRMTAPLANKDGQNKILNLILSDENEKVRKLVDITNEIILKS